MKKAIAGHGKAAEAQVSGRMVKRLLQASYFARL
jgi:Holliday junction resolvasome RuvABC endonuclease subunit